MQIRNTPYQIAALVILLQTSLADAEVRGPAADPDRSNILPVDALSRQHPAADVAADLELRVGTEGPRIPAEATLLGPLAPEGAGALRVMSDGGKIRSLIVAAATRHDIPVWFLARLIGRESGFDPGAVSRVGALGIAQFMPATAAERGLRDPLDPVQAIPKSAELLNDLMGRFGNLGLAAAAYNAGPQRVRSWLSGRSGLPFETRSYVLAITGRPVQEWAPPGTISASPGAPSSPRLEPALPTAQAPDLLSRNMPALRLLDTETAGRESLSSTNRMSQERKVTVLLQAEARQRRAGPGRGKGRAAGEQSLCSLMNAVGSTCIVQKIY